ncbi:MAG: HigA family addiction module antidote protein [Calditrichaeota bacterium]|nr:HigA family addiction module antidote protein [Calditrichota bacterium]
MKSNEIRHPGEILSVDYLKPIGLSQNKLARLMHVDPSRVSLIINMKRGITGDTDIRLAKVLGTRKGYWLNLQKKYDLYQAKVMISMTELKQIKPYTKALKKAQ